MGVWDDWMHQIGFILQIFGVNGLFWKKKTGYGVGGSSVSKGEPTLMEAAARMSL